MSIVWNEKKEMKWKKKKGNELISYERGNSSQGFFSWKENVAIDGLKRSSLLSLIIWDGVRTSDKENWEKKYICKVKNKGVTNSSHWHLFQASRLCTVSHLNVY